MYLKRLEIQGFKTFAAHTVLEFRPGITAIVGPNGSGKSNLNDAVRWVLGEQALGAIRSKRSEDLIFSGGTRRAPAGFAEVALTIDNSDRLLPVPYGEVTITRRATRSGDHEYYINRARVRLRDLQEAVGPLGGSYTIINQGLVDAALTLRPEERRRLFEDAAEIGTFVSRKHETNARLRETSANMDRCADILAELEPRLRSLKRQASLAHTHREMSVELRELLVEHYTFVWHAAQAHSVAAQADERALHTQLEQRRAAHAAATAALSEQRAALHRLREHLAALQREHDEHQRHVEALQRDLAVAAERLHALEQRIAEAARSSQEWIERHAEIAREQTAATERLAAMEARVTVARAAVNQHQQALAAQEVTRRDARQQLELAQREEASVTAALGELRRRLQQFTEQRARLKDEQTTQHARLVQAETALEEQRVALHDAEQRAATATEQRAEAAAIEERTRAELGNTRGERARAEETLAAARRTQADLEARLESLSRLQRSYAGTFAGVKAAMQWAETERRAGFALVASIVRTPAQLETAIEVALGSRLQNIVVERWQDAEDTIAALKRSGAGRATFLPLDTLRGQTPDPRSPTPDPAQGVLGVAATLVDYDQHYETVVWSLLGRTLIVDDLQVARAQLRRLSGGWAIVTLAGEQVNSGGAVTGGAQIKEAGVLRRERELRELPEQIAVAQQTVADRQHTLQTLAERIQAGEHLVRQAETARRQAEQAHDACRDAEARARREVAQAESALEAQHRRHSQIGDELAALDTQAQTRQHERAELEEREHIAAAHLAELRAAEQQRAHDDQAAHTLLAELRAVLATVESESRNEARQVAALDQQRARLAEQRRDHERRRTALDHERAALDERRTEQQRIHTEHAAQIAALVAQIAPPANELSVREAASAATEGAEMDAAATLLHAESALGRASVEVQRAKDRIDTIWERAASDDVDIEEIGSGVRKDALQDTASLVLNPQSSVLNEEELQSKIQTLKSKIARLGAVNPLALEEYEEAHERYQFLGTQVNDLRQAAAALDALISELDEAMTARFATTFSAIAVEFERYFARLFGGGQAKLLLTSDEGRTTKNDNAAPNGVAHANGSANGYDAPLETLDGAGIEIIARPPGKRQQTLSLLSGGERSLTAAALLFAILTVNPSPFCILDEVDAALDESNVGRFRDLLRDMASETQFILVTHNRGTIEVADTIYGVSMGDDGASRVLSLRLEELAVA